MKVFLRPFNTIFANKEVMAWTVYTKVPESEVNRFMTQEECPHCQSTHIYKFVEEPFNHIDKAEKEEVIFSYHCKCASCSKPFIVEIDILY